MSGAIQDWNDAKQGATTVKAVKKSGDASDEDDEEEGWEAMKQKREKKKSIWRSKKDDNTSGTMKDLWVYATESG
jgi:glutamyl/glutaminyl-tRNA synthetase